MLIFGIVLVAVPLWAPGAFIVIGAIGWTVAYLYIYVSSIGHDLSNTIPWMVVSDTHFWSYLILISLFGLIRGPMGSIALLVVWGPLIMLPAFLVTVGLGTTDPHGWEGYVSANYQNERCQTDWDAPADRHGKHPGYCIREPKPGINIPPLVTDEWGKVLN